MNGLVLVDKPSGLTSHDVVNRWRRLAGTKRVGHLGTLDPMATGLLALVTGSATRLAQFFGKDEKTYEAEITLGKVSDSYDADSEVTDCGMVQAPSVERVCEALNPFRGAITQIPPPVSAKKIKGVRAYTLARQKQPVELAPVPVFIRTLQLNKVEAAHVSVTVTCSSGTYIRSLAHDLGNALGCGAILSRLRRTHIGSFSVENARTLECLTELAAQGGLAQAVIPSRALLPQMPSEYFDLHGELQIRQGRDFRTSPFVVKPGSPFVKAISHTGELIAIGELRFPNVYHPGTVL